VTAVAPTLSYCVVNTNGREYLLACLDAIERTHPQGVEREVLVLDNASTDGSAEAVRARDDAVRLIALEQRIGKAENDSALMRKANGRYCLLLNEDSELRSGAVEALVAALDADPRAAAATPQLLDSGGEPVPCAWRFPGVGTALAGALFLHRLFTVQSKGSTTRLVDWAQSSALLVRREAAAEVGYMDPAFFVYYDECDFAKRLAEGGWHSLFVPGKDLLGPRPPGAASSSGSEHRRHNPALMSHFPPLSDGNFDIARAPVDEVALSFGIRRKVRHRGQGRESSSISSASYVSGMWPSTAGSAVRRARRRWSRSPGWRRRLSQARSPLVKKPVASRASG
jgi:glycosyltransferase involved in cell wall biosynthesis